MKNRIIHEINFCFIFFFMKNRMRIIHEINFCLDFPYEKQNAHHIPDIFLFRFSLWKQDARYTRYISFSFFPCENRMHIRCKVYFFFGFSLSKTGCALYMISTFFSYFPYEIKEYALYTKSISFSFFIHEKRMRIYMTLFFFRFLFMKKGCAFTWHYFFFFFSYEK